MAERGLGSHRFHSEEGGAHLLSSLRLSTLTGGHLPLASGLGKPSEVTPQAVSELGRPCISAIHLHHPGPPQAWPGSCLFCPCCRTSLTMFLSPRTPRQIQKMSPQHASVRQFAGCQGRRGGGTAGRGMAAAPAPALPVQRGYNVYLGHCGLQT
jgi:hypothetical protein